jgi:hypothetical protein
MSMIVDWRAGIVKVASLEEAKARWRESWEKAKGRRIAHDSSA